jgi:hypothetical protein
MSTTAPVQAVALPRPDLQTIQITLVGTSALICHRWSSKAKKQMLDKQTKRASVGKVAKDPDEDYRESLYPHPDGGYAFPSVAFKAAAVRAGTYSEMKMTFLRGAFHVLDEYVKIEGEPSPREDMVRLQSGVADIRYRAEFKTWTAILKVRYNARAINVEQLLNLFQVAGFSVGVGEWRPEKDGSYGMWEIAS